MAVALGYHRGSKNNCFGEDTNGERLAAVARRTSCRLSAHAPDPRIRGCGARGIFGRQHSGLRASLCRRGGVGRRRVHASRRPRRHRLHASRPRPLHRQGLRHRRHDARDFWAEGRALRRQGRLHAHRRPVEGHARRERHRRRRRAARLRRGADGQDAEDRRRRRLLLRRRRLQPGRGAGELQSRKDLEPADGFRRRGQRLCGIDRLELVGRRQPGRARRRDSASPRARWTAQDFFEVYEAAGEAIERARARRRARRCCT